jgi:hypothetical protein
MNIMIQPVAFASSSAWISYIALVMNIMIQPVAFVSSSAEELTKATGWIIIFIANARTNLG